MADYRVLSDYTCAKSCPITACRGCTRTGARTHWLVTGVDADLTRFAHYRSDAPSGSRVDIKPWVSMRWKARRGSSSPPWPGATPATT